MNTGLMPAGIGLGRGSSMVNGHIDRSLCAPDRFRGFRGESNRGVGARRRVMHGRAWGDYTGQGLDPGVGQDWGSTPEGGAVLRTLVAIPIYNEENHVREVLDRVLTHAGNVLVVDDGSTDGTSEILKQYPIDVIRHAVNRGYGRSVRDAFMWADADRYDWVLTMDSDSQHEPDDVDGILFE